MKKTLILMALGMLAASSSFASHSTHPYGMSGCGLGSMVMDQDTPFKQVLSATTNGTAGNQTFGITSGTSNCTKDGTVAKAKEAELFIEANQIALANDIARGNGETVAHLSKVLGCSDDAAVGAALQKNYRSIFSTDNIKNSAVGSSIIGTLKVSGGCSSLVQG